MSFLIPALAGFVTGVLSAWGIGGGSLLVVYMTVFAGVPQQTAQGVNLTYFLPTSLTALYSHLKNKLVETRLAVPAVITGVLTAVGTALAASALDTGVLKIIFGVFIILVGAGELFRKTEKGHKKE
jgi:uncharacterized membrane protein YfcA